jgi:hypothetical protein
LLLARLLTAAATAAARAHKLLLLLTDDLATLASPAVSSCVAEAHDAAGVAHLWGLSATNKHSRTTQHVEAISSRTHTWKEHHEAHDAAGVAHFWGLDKTNEAKNNSRLNISQTAVQLVILAAAEYPRTTRKPHDQIKLQCSW